MTIAERVGQRLTERGEWRAGMSVVGRGMIRHVTTTLGRQDWLSFPVWGALIFGEDDAEIIPDLTDWPTLGVLIGVIHGATRNVQVSGYSAAAKLHEAWENSTGEAIGALYLAVTSETP